MKKIIFITGATDGIGLETAIKFAKNGHDLILHGRNNDKLLQLKNHLLKINSSLKIELFSADFSNLSQVSQMAELVLNNISQIDVLINNAGIFIVNNNQVLTVDGLDIRFAVNTIAPYILTKKLFPIFTKETRIINLASAAQAPVDIDALNGKLKLSHDNAYAQSKLALIIWSMELAKSYPDGPSIISVNPKSFLGSKMVKEAYGRQGFDLNIGADILYRAALSDEFANANGKYYDNDYESFANPHRFALIEKNRTELVSALDKFIS